MNGDIIFVKAGCMVSRQKVYRLASCDDLCLVHLKTIHTTFFGAPRINIDWMGSWITCREWFHGTWTYDAFRRWCLWKWKVPQKHPLKYVEFLFLIPQISIFLGSQIKIDHFPSIIDVIMRNLNYPMFTHPTNQPTQLWFLSVFLPGPHHSSICPGAETRVERIHSESLRRWRGHGWCAWRLGLQWQWGLWWGCQDALV